MGFIVDDKRREKIINLIETLLNKIGSYEEVIEVLQNQRINFTKELYVDNFRKLSTEVLFSFPIMYDCLNKAFKTDKWEKNIHQYMEIIDIELKKNKSLNLSTHYGICALGYAANAASCNGLYYKNLINVTNKYLNNNIQYYILQLEKNELCDYHYDVFSGVTGIGRYLLRDIDNEDSYASLILILNYIVKTSKEKKWIIDNKNILTEYKRKLYKQGYKDLGLAHGIAGPLQLLGLCYNKGIKVEKIKEVISELVDLYKTEQKDIAGMKCWNNYIEPDREIVKKRVTSPSWCYGNVGISRSLFTAGQALGDKKLQSDAVALISQFAKEFNSVKLNSSAFCHGYSGILYAANAFYDEIDKSNNLEEIKKLEIIINKSIDYILDSYDELSLFGYIEESYDTNGKSMKVNKISIVDGVISIIVSLTNILDSNSTEIFSNMMLMR